MGIDPAPFWAPVNVEYLDFDFDVPFTHPKVSKRGKKTIILLGLYYFNGDGDASGLCFYQKYATHVTRKQEKKQL